MWNVEYFIYTDLEFEIMKSDIRFCGENSCDGVVIGMLNPDGTVDRNRELVETAHQYGMGVTFHRAFDRSNDLVQAMEDIIDLGCERFLTSGGYNTALEGSEVIRRTGLKEIHGTFRSRKAGGIQYRNTKLTHEQELPVTDPEKNKNCLGSVIRKLTCSFS